TLVVLGHLLGQSIIGPEHVPQRRRRQTADGEFRSAVQKLPAIYADMDVSIEKTKQLRIEITPLFSFHTIASLSWWGERYPTQDFRSILVRARLVPSEPACSGH